MAKNPKSNETATEAETIPTDVPPAAAPAPAGGTTTKKRTKVAERDWINEAGEVVAEELATGVRYTNIATGEKVELQSGGKAGSMQVMLWCFGALTLFGNVANTRINGLGGTGQEAIDDIKERIELLNSGKWIERGEGAARGPKYDLAKLATALVDSLVAKGKTDAPSKYEKFLAKLTEDKSYFAQVRSNPEVQARYAELTGKKAKEVDTLDID